MKLVRYGDLGREKPGILDANGGIRDLSRFVPDIGGLLLGADLSSISQIEINSLSLVEGNPRIGACVGNSSKIVGIGLNYISHAEEAGMALPSEPVLFIKTPNTIAGPYDNVIIPRGSTKADYEVELAIVIGKMAKYVSEAEALKYVAGYCIANDVSEREWQLEKDGKQWAGGKCVDGFLPLGPYLVTPDEITDPQKLQLTCRINGELRQNGNTSDMAFSIAKLISYVSEKMTLMPGDVIITGTPFGVGMGQKPEPVYLKPGDIMELEIEGLGVQKQTLCAEQFRHAERRGAKPGGPPGPRR